MKNKYLVIISAFSIVCMLNKQTLQARSETSYEMEEGAERGEEAAGPVGAAVGGLFGGAVGLVKDTGDTVSGRTYEDQDMRYREERDMDMRDREMREREGYADIYADMGPEEETEPRSETAREMERGTAHGEEVAGPVGGVVGGILGAGVGLVEDTGEFVTGEKAEDREMYGPEQERPVTMQGEMRDDTLNIDEVG